VTTGHRVCAQCATPLARDQSGSRCSPCQRSGQHPPDLAALWRDDRLLAALRSRHFGRVIAAYRHAIEPIVTQRTVGELLGLTQAQVSRLEAAQVPPANLVKLQRWSAALGIPPDLLWFAPADKFEHLAATNGRTWTRSQHDGDTVERRKFLMAAGATAIGATLLTGPDVVTARPTNRGCIAEGVRDMTRHFRALDNRFGGGHSRSVASSYLSTIVEPQLRNVRGPDSDRRPLYTAAAELHHLIGWMTFDIGQPVAGHQHLRQALKLCQEAGDDALAGEMLAGMSHQTAFHGSPSAAIDLALAAGHSASRSGTPALRAEAAVMEAHALALQKNRSGALAALGDAERAFNASDLSASPDWLSYFDHAYLAAKFGHTFKELGMPTEAEQFARRSLDMTDGYDRGLLFNTALLAAALADQGKIEESCATAASAVRMSDAVRSVRGTTYLTDVGTRLAPNRSLPDVKELFELMVEAGLPTP